MKMSPIAIEAISKNLYRMVIMSSIEKSIHKKTKSGTFSASFIVVEIVQNNSARTSTSMLDASVHLRTLQLIRGPF